MNWFRKDKEAAELKAATAQAMRDVARRAVPAGAIVHYVEGLEAILAYYETCPPASRPKEERVAAAQVALVHAKGDPLVAEKLTAFAAALAVQGGHTQMTQEMAFRAAAIQGSLIVNYRGTASGH
jgi:hypothetical protein